MRKDVLGAQLPGETGEQPTLGGVVMHSVSCTAVHCSNQQEQSLVHQHASFPTLHSQDRLGLLTVQCGSLPEGLGKQHHFTGPSYKRYTQAEMEAFISVAEAL
ncbi:hypothetical protein EOD39_1147 [Acipenser ruthenus]|uniref:Uncharacterized protein n=1 Tax=Acipenser ruthenus TaxID=7906 RepID=A0A444UG80_ACIRT|nr:hypothetical protein EOD39_1147 [Acipenser ruthenus]